MIILLHFKFRYFGSTGVAYEQRLSDFEELMRRLFAAFGNIMISDFIPYMSFIPKLQGWVSEIRAIRAFSVKLMGDIMQVDKHRERAQKTDTDSQYVPDFVDVLLKAPLDGELLQDRDIISLINVRTLLHLILRKKAQSEYQLGNIDH